MDWVDKEKLILEKIKQLEEEFSLTDDYRKAFLNWHKKKFPEEWGND